MSAAPRVVPPRRRPACACRSVCVVLQCGSARYNTTIQYNRDLAFVSGRVGLGALRVQAVVVGYPKLGDAPLARQMGVLWGRAGPPSVDTDAAAIFGEDSTVPVGGDGRA